MRYYLDCEFIEGFHKPLLGKRRHFIDLISIGIVAEDGREYYAISSDYSHKDADLWVMNNVIRPMYIDAVHGDMRNQMDCTNFHKKVGKSNKQIAIDLINFINPECLLQLKCGLWPDMEEVGRHNPDRSGNAQPEIYAYFADYDWVLFCSLFGRMVDLPKGFPMYCRDLKQIMDEQGLDQVWQDKHVPQGDKEHNALADAKWNKNLHEQILKQKYVTTK